MSKEKAVLAPSNKEVRFGWKPATSDQKARMIPFGSFLKRYGGKPPPAKVAWQDKAQAALNTMLGNDREGNCVVAATMHGIGVWTANEPGGKEVVPTTAETSQQYRQICGPGDNGCYIPSVLDHFRDKGLIALGKVRKIEGFVKVNPRDQLLVKTATHLFGGLHLGVNWPGQWMNDAKPGGVLRPGDNNIVGGHAVQVVGYDDVGLQISTWGIVCTMSWDALADRRYVDECYAMIGDDWYNDQGATAAGAGVDVKKLREALDVIKGGGTPDIPDDTDPPVDPPAPVDPGNLIWEFLREFDVFGFTLHLHASLSRSSARSIFSASWFQALMIAWDVVRAIRSGDWATAIASAQELVRVLAELFAKDNNPALAKFFEGLHAKLAARNGAPKLVTNGGNGSAE